MKLNFIQHTRPGISFAFQYLSQFLNIPCAPHLLVGIYVFRHLIYASDQGIFFPSSPFLSLSTYVDSDWDTCPSSKCSVTGFYIFLGGCPISLKSNK